MTGALNTLVGDSIDGAVGLLGGNTGEVIIYAGAILIIGVIVTALYYIVSFAKRR